MQWLISQIWILLAVAALLGLILGLALRGLMSAGKMRKATVERDVARTELGQARSEIDALYASQRKMKEDGVVSVDTSELDSVRADLQKRDEQISELQVALQAARDDAEAAKSERHDNTLQTAGAAVAGAVGGALLGGGDDEKAKELEERNTWLEERVAALESDLEAASANAEASETHEVDAPEVITAPETTDTGVSAAKLEWQNTYLRQRVEALEDRMQVTPVPVPAALATTAPTATEDTDTTESDEELARLRWRNRYLEGRLAYYEDGEAGAAEERAEAAAETEEDEDSGMIAAAVAGAGAVAAVATLSDDEADAEEVSEETEEEVELSADDEASDDTAEIEEDVVDAPAETETSDNDEDSHTEVEEEHVSETILKSLDETDDTQAEDEPEENDESVSEAVEEASEDAEADPVDTDDGAPSEDPSSDSVEPMQPITMSKPKEGGDDLTEIGGIGPRIAEVLNGLGIWQHGQIADWTPEHSAWIDEHLSFKGRVERERWVEQAKVLAENQETSSD